MTVLFAYIPIDTDEKAKALARTVVSRRAAACANILGPMTSVYEWEGVVREESEWLIILKTTTERKEELTELVMELHGYDCPCVVYLPISDGNPAFLQWVDTRCRPDGKKTP